MKKIAILLCLVLVLAVGCSKKNVGTVIVTDQDTGPTPMSLDYRDFQNAANAMVQDMLSSGAVSRPGGGRYVMAISTILNDTTQRIDTDQLTKTIRIALLRSGKVVTTTAVAAGGPEDAMSMQARELRKSDEFNQKTVAKKGQMIAPDLSLSGKIFQRNIRLDSSTEQVEYSFMLSLTDINSGLALWEGEKRIVKRGSNDTVNW